MALTALLLSASASWAEAPSVGFSGSFTVNEDANTNTGNISVSTTNGSASVTITISIGQGSLSAPGFSGNGSTSISRTATAATLTTALASMTYQSGLNNNNNNTPAGSRTLNVTAVNNTNGGSSSPSQVISITPVNDPPVVTVPGAQNVDEDTLLAIGGGVVSVADVDLNEGSGNISVNFSTVSGLIGLATDVVGGVTSAQITVNDSNDVTVVASLTAINTTLADAAGLRYQSFPDVNGADTITVLANDLGNTGTPGAQTDSENIAVTVNAVNDAPEILGNFPNATEDVDTAIPGVTVTDVDINETGSSTMDVTLVVNKGTLTVNSVGGLTFLNGTTASGTNIQFRASLANVNTAVGSLSYLTLLDDTSLSSVTMTVDDRGFTGSGGALTDSRVLGIGVNAVNDPESINAPASASGSDGVPIAIPVSITGDAQETVTAQLIVTLSVASGGLNLGTVDFLNFTTGDGTNDTTMVFQGEVTDVNLALATLSFEGLANTTLNLSVDDQGFSGSGGSLVSNDSVPITVNAVNDQPVVTGPANASGAEDTPIVIAGTVISDQDIGAGNFTVTLSASNGTMTVVASGGAAVGGNASSMVTVTGNSNDVNNTVATITYQGNAFFNGNDTVVVEANDNGNTGSPGPLTGTGMVAVAVSAVNNAPTITAPVSVNATEDVAFPLAGVSVADVDADEGTGIIQVGLSVNNGTVTLGTTTGLSFQSGANGTGSMTVRGTLVNLNNALATLSYLGNADFNDNVGGPDTLNISANDLGQSGSGGNKAAGQNMTINVAPVNDPPVVTAPASINANEEAATLVAGISVADVDLDEGGGAISVSLAVSDGTLDLSGPATITGDMTASVVVTGQLADVNTTLATVTYTGNALFNGQDNLNIAANDLGNTGSGGPQIGTNLVVINVNELNDAPVLDPSGDLFVLPLFKNDFDNNGTLIEDVLSSDGGDPIFDPDPGAVEGIAVITYDDTHGDWQFSIDDGTNWNDIPFPSTINATLLAVDGVTRIRFVPQTNFVGEVDPGFTFRAWDQTVGVNGGLKDTSDSGGTHPTSVGVDSVRVTVRPRIDAKNDFDGDNTSDIAVFEPATGMWFVRGSTEGFISAHWGYSETTPIPADYDGDGRDDVAVYEPASGNWYIRKSVDNSLRIQQFGYGGTVPVPCDYDGDGHADIALFEPSTGNWYFLLSEDASFHVQQFGYGGTVPVPCDYDGDGKCDMALFEPSTGTWYMLLTRTDELVTKTLGSETTAPVPCDYDADGCCDAAVFERSTGTWTLLLSGTGTQVTQQWGYSATDPVPGNYDLDNLADITIFEPSPGGLWYVLGTTAGFFSQQWGYSATVPVSVQHHVNQVMGLTP